MLNAHEFQITCTDSDAIAYMIAITETDLGDTEILLKKIPVIPSEYVNLAYVFSEEAANTLPEHDNHDLYLETTGATLFGPLYNLS